MMETSKRKGWCFALLLIEYRRILIVNLHSTTFMIDDWIKHTPKDILAKNFGVDPSVFGKVPEKYPYILNGTVEEQKVTGGNGALVGNSSFVYHSDQHVTEPVPGNGGTFRKVDSTTFPIAKTIAAAVVELEPKGLRELHWHPNVRVPESFQQTI